LRGHLSSSRFVVVIELYDDRRCKDQGLAVGISLTDRIGPPAWPRPVQGRTLFARLQQFSASLVGRLVVAGLGWVSGRGSTYWGHNAFIRVDAFTQCCGLPKLSGKPPLGGEILSHDFIEAALLVRAGWAVRIGPDLGGSYEEAPPKATRELHLAGAT
jgi:membrane glycosyltransferase